MLDAAVVDMFVARLNDIAIYDRDAMQKLLTTRVPCNQVLAKHPTVQVSAGRQVGFLGMLNGLLGDGAPSRGRIAAVFDDDGIFIRFQRAGAADGSP